MGFIKKVKKVNIILFIISLFFQYFYDTELDLRKLSDKIVITPKQLAENLGLNAKEDYLAELYEKKYLKYKMKYLQLKQKFFE